MPKRTLQTDQTTLKKYSLIESVLFASQPALLSNSTCIKQVPVLSTLFWAFQKDLV